MTSTAERRFNREVPTLPSAIPPDSSLPTPDQTAELHRAYAAYIRAKPWSALPNDQPLVIHNTVRRYTAYLAVHRDALSYYHGRNGLRHYLSASNSLPGLSECLTAFVRTAPQIHPEERAAIDDLKLGYHSRRPWPIFRSIIPFHPEWPLNAPQTRDLTIALRHAAIAAEHIRQHPAPAVPEDPETPPLAPIWSILPDKQHSLDWMVLPYLDQVTPSYPVYEPHLLEKARILPATDEAWTVAQLPLPYALYNHAFQAERPHYPVTTMVAVSTEPSSFHLTMLDLKRHAIDRQQSVLLQAMLRLNRLPARITTHHPHALTAIQPVLRELSIAGHYSMDLPFDADDVQPILDQMATISLPHSAASIPIPPSNATKDDHPVFSHSDPLIRRHGIAAVLHSRFHNPARDVSSPRNMATVRHISPEMSYEQAIYAIAAVNGGPVDLTIAARIIADAAAPQSPPQNRLLRRLREVVAHHPQWQPLDPEEPNPDAYRNDTATTDPTAGTIVNPDTVNIQGRIQPADPMRK